MIKCKVRNVLPGKWELGRAKNGARETGGEGVKRRKGINLFLHSLAEGFVRPENREFRQEIIGRNDFG